MVVNLLEGLYPDFVGRRQLFCGSGSGPVSYNATTGDPVSLSNPRLYIDILFGGVQSTTGTHFVVAKPSGTGVRQQWSLFYYVSSTGAPAANGNLSGEVFQLGGFCGQF